MRARCLWLGYLSIVHLVALLGIGIATVYGYFVLGSQQEAPVYDGVICDTRTANMWTMLQTVRLIPAMPAEIHVDHYPEHNVSVIRPLSKDSSQRCAFICRAFTVSVHRCAGEPPRSTDVPMHKLAMR